MSSPGHGTKAVLAAFFANLGIAIAKFVGFAITGASSMLAEAIHSCADSGNQLLLLLGGRRGRRVADEEHPFGYGAARYFWAFVVAVVLFTLGALFSLYEGIEKLRHAHAIESVGVALAILAVSIVLEIFSLRTAVQEARPLLRGQTWWQFIRDAKTPELPTVLLEDVAALSGLVIAFIGLLLGHLTHDARWDAAGTLAIGLLLGVVALVLGREMQSLLLGEAAAPDQAAAIRGALEARPEIRRVIHLRTRHLGPDELLVAVKADFGGTLTSAKLVKAINEAEGAVRAAVPTAKMIFIEPDIYQSA